MDRYEERNRMKEWILDETYEEEWENPLSLTSELAFELANIAGLQLVPDGYWIDAAGNIYSQQEALSLLPVLTL